MVCKIFIPTCTSLPLQQYGVNRLPFKQQNASYNNQENYQIFFQTQTKRKSDCVGRNIVDN